MGGPGPPASTPGPPEVPVGELSEGTSRIFCPLEGKKTAPPNIEVGGAIKIDTHFSLVVGINLNYTLLHKALVERVKSRHIFGSTLDTQDA